MTDYERNLKAAMKAKGLTGRALAKALGVKPTTISTWFKRGVSGTHLLSLCRILDVQPEEVSPHFHGAATGSGQVSVRDDGDKVTQCTLPDDAMKPEMRKGDEVIIDEMRTPSAGQYVGAMFNGEIVVRKYGMAEESPTLVPNNTDVFPVIKSDFKVLGVVVRHVRHLL